MYMQHIPFYSANNLLKKLKKASIALLAVYLSINILNPTVTYAQEDMHYEVKNFATFSIALPNTWQIQQENINTLFVQAQEKCAISISVAPHQGSIFREMGIAFYQRLKGASPKDDAGGLTFTMQSHEKLHGIARLTYQGENFVLVTAYGTCKEMQNILSSLTMHEQATQEAETAQSIRPYPLLLAP